MMQQTRVSILEDGKDLPQHKPANSKFFPSKLLFFFLLFLVVGVCYTVFSISMTRPFGVQNIAPLSFGVQSRVDQLIGLGRWIKPPSSLIHTMSDEELFWAASLVPQIGRYPFRRVPKIAFMFLTKGPLPLYPLWDKFFSGHEELYSIYVHSLPSYEPKYPPGSAFYRRQIPSQVSEWGRMSMCDAERRLLANALLDFSNEWFVLLSESCIPLFNFSIVYNYVMKSQYSFLGAFDDKGPYGRGRYNISMYPEVNITDWRKASQWFEVNRKLAVLIVRDTKYYPIFKENCKPACYVDEHYFPTMLSIQVPQFLANRTLTYVDWSRGGAHPATFGMPDITEGFLKKIIVSKTCNYNGQNTTLCYLFARKFAPSALQPLLYLAPKSLGFG